jgi:hypothetical protein
MHVIKEGEMPVQITPAGLFSNDIFHCRAYHVFPAPALMAININYHFENYLIQVSQSNVCETP